MIGQLLTGRSGRRFKVVREIGRGGFGTVYRVEDEAGNVYALKAIAAVDDPTVANSFEQEVQSTSSIAHDNVLKIVDNGRFNGTLFVVSEYCADGDYRRRLSASRSQPPDVSVTVPDFRQILAGLRVLHTRIIHRDLKPENVLISGTVLKIADFGLARFVDMATRTHTFKGAGTPYYMAPEVWLMNRATPATDLYAVGVMLYEAFTGELPFIGKDLNALRELHLYSPAPRAKARNAGIPDIIDGIIKRLLAKEPQARYQAAEEVLEALSSLAPATAPSQLAEVAARMRLEHDRAEAVRLSERKARAAEQDANARARYMENELLTMADDVVAEINAQLAETKIERISRNNSREFRFGRRTLTLRFFQEGDMYRDPLVPPRLEVLRKRCVVHGGVIEIQEGGQDREGWNVVLVRPAESIYGEWLLVESRLSPLSRRIAPFEPIATEANLLADNLANHWAPAMHVFNLVDKSLERGDLIRILGVLIP